MDSVGDERTVNVFGREIPRALFIVRLFYLLYFASFGSLFPLLAVYFKQLGMTAAQAGLLLGSRPLVEFIAVRFWSEFAEKFKKGTVLTFTVPLTNIKNFFFLYFSKTTFAFLLGLSNCVHLGHWLRSAGYPLLCSPRQEQYRKRMQTSSAGQRDYSRWRHRIH